MDSYPKNTNSTSMPAPNSMAAEGALYGSGSHNLGIERHTTQSALPMPFNGPPTTSTVTSSLGYSLRNVTSGTTTSAPTSFIGPNDRSVVPVDRKGKRRQDDAFLDESSKRVKESAHRKAFVDAQASDIIIAWMLANPAVASTPSHPHLNALEAVTGVEYKVINCWIHERFGLQDANCNGVAMEFDEVLRIWAKYHPQENPDPEILDAFGILARTDFRTIYQWFHTYFQKEEPPIPKIDVLPAPPEVRSPDLPLGQASSQALVPYNANGLLTSTNAAQFQSAALAAALEKDCKANKSVAEVAANMQSAWDPDKRFPCLLGCGHACNNKSEFVRHEICYAQEAWICSLSKLMQFANGDRACTSQNCTLDDEHHWATEHEGDVPCNMKLLQAGRSGRIFFRADHLKQHNRIHHRHLGLGKQYIDSCEYTLDNKSFPRRCGFCGHTWANYHDRVDHLEVHFKNGRGLDTWQDPWIDPDNETNNESGDDDDGDGNDDSGDGDHQGGDGNQFDETHFNSFMDNFDNYYDPGAGGGSGAGSASSDFFRYSFHSAALGLLDAIVWLQSGSRAETAHDKNSSPATAAARAQIQAFQARGSFWARVNDRGFSRLGATTIPPAGFRLLELKGVGAISTINTLDVKNSTTGVLALKHTRLKGSTEAVRARVTSFIREYFIMSTMSHPHVLKAYGLSFESPRLGILMPAAETDLQKIFDEGPPTSITRPILNKAFGCLAAALSYLHDKGVYHNDIKPANILIDKGSAMFCDFGISRLHHRLKAGTSSLSYDGNGFTRRYAAPERIENPFATRHGMRSDVFSLGCVFLEIEGVLCDRPVEKANHSPPAAEHEQLLLVLRGLRGPVSTRDKIATIQAMRSALPASRPPASELTRRFPGTECCKKPDDDSSQIRELLKKMMGTTSGERTRIAVLQYPKSGIDVGASGREFSTPLSAAVRRYQVLPEILSQDRKDTSMASLPYRCLSNDVAAPVDSGSNATADVQRWIQNQEIASQASGLPPFQAEDIDTHNHLVDHCDFVPSPRSPVRYAYRSLQSDQREIRLLQLLPSEDFDSRLRGWIEHVSLDDEDHRPYEALSYVWGDPEPRDEIYITNSLIKTTKNLGLALRHLRRFSEPRILWIDAVCINQDDNVEKGHQIGLMNSIYSSAQRVVAWLGESDQSLCCSWQSCKGHRKHDVSGRGDPQRRSAKGCDHAKPMRRYHELVNNILGRPWFKRLWTIQEAVLAPSLTFVLGSQDLSSMCDDLLEDGYSSDGGSKVHFLHRTVRDFLFGNRSGSKHGHLRSTVHDWLSVTDFLRQRRDEMRLLELLERFRGYQATDDRDKVYAIMGLLSDKDRHRLVPDYSMSTAELYSSVARSIIAQSKSLEVLSYAAKDRDRPGSLDLLPSWVPDWTQRRTIATIWSCTFDAAQVSSQVLMGQDATRWQGYIFWDDPDVFTGESQTSQLDKSLQRTRLRLTSILVDTVIDDLYPLCKGPSDWVAYETLTKPHKQRAISLGKQIMATLEHWTDSKGYTVQGRHRRGGWALLNACACAGMALTSDGTWDRYVDSPDLNLAALQSGSLSLLMETFLISVTIRSGQRKAFVTSEGFFGMGPAAAEYGDTIAVFPGGRVPFALRKAGSGEYTLIGECYVYGLMDGEALGLGLPFTDIVIV